MSANDFPTARYLAEIIVSSCRVCHHRTATCELMDRWNGSLGFVCRPCGKAAIKEAKKEEGIEW